MVNFENGASGKTPVNKTNLNKMQTDMQDFIKDYVFTQTITVSDFSLEANTHSNAKYALANEITNYSDYIVFAQARTTGSYGDWLVAERAILTSKTEITVSITNTGSGTTTGDLILYCVFIKK